MGKPKIRFKGYNDEWEQRKLGDLADRVTRKNQDLVSELPLTISAQYGLIDQNEFFDKRVASKDVSGYYLIENGEFAYNKSTDAPWGAIKRLDRYENGVLSTLYIVFGIKENNPVDSDFLVLYYSTNLWHKGIHEIAAEGARNHGLLNIAPADFFETKLMISQDIEEQNKIGKYFEELERLITLHQRNPCNLNKFMAFDWEQRKLGEVAQEFKSGNFLKADEIDIAGDYPVYGGNGLRGYTSTYNHDGEFALIGRQGALCGNMNYSVGKAYFTEHAVVVEADENNDTRFLYCMLDIMNLGQYSDQSAQPGLAVNKLIKLENFFPQKEEQQQIGWYFNTLDRLITLHQRKYDEMKTLKKYMLQKMFPQNGPKIPKIRFEGFTGEWEQRKLGNVLKFQNGFNGSKERYGTGTKLISVMDILNDDFITYESIRGLADVTEEEKERFSVDFGDVLFQRSSENVEDAGRTNVYLDRKRAVFGGFVIRGKKNSDYQPEFMRYVLDTKMIRKQITTKAQGAQHINVSQETLQDVLFCLPSKEEQIRIGNYFRNLDNLITLHQRKCNELKNIKKFMLQSMFV